jgi:hypothetical protein
MCKLAFAAWKSCYSRPQFRVALCAALAFDTPAAIAYPMRQNRPVQSGGAIIEYSKGQTP